MSTISINFALRYNGHPFTKLTLMIIAADYALDEQSYSLKSLSKLSGLTEKEVWIALEDLHQEHAISFGTHETKSDLVYVTLIMPEAEVIRIEDYRQWR